MTITTESASLEAGAQGTWDEEGARCSARVGWWHRGVGAWACEEAFGGAEKDVQRDLIRRRKKSTCQGLYSVRHK